MVAAFPLAKLGLLVVKQISKPLANAIARRAKSSKFFRNWVCIPTAQIFHWADVKVRMRILNLGKVSKVPKLDETKAIETGAQLLSEFVILAVGAGVLIYEYRRQSEKEDLKQAEINREKLELKQTVDHLTFAVETQAAQLRELSRITGALHDDLSKKTGQKPKNDGGGGGWFGGSKNNNSGSDLKQVNFQHNVKNFDHNVPVDEELAISSFKRPGQILAAVHELNLRSI